ncbi:sensor histidine kinase [Actinoplanes sp. TFC3]|uniref:sensor histidine kinase n=1 Tax=Actinoplanes sp. TFC3 TaxID=1710355 RepID=UPI0009E986CD|nr:sensor histidine kinase [Actinoplanes sp. TFC3]
MRLAGATSGHTLTVDVCEAFGVILLRAWKGTRVWRELTFVLTAAILSTPTFALALLGIVASALSVAIFGLAPLSGILGLARLTPRYFRAPARRLLGWTWPDPPPLGRRPVIAVLSDATAWRALAYCFLRFPLFYVGAYGAVLALLLGSLALTYPVWRLSAPHLIDGPAWQITLALIILLALPWYLRLIILLDSLLVRALLRPSPAARRSAHLEAGRAALQADATAMLRRVERDLHDGTQARLVALGVALSRIESRSTEAPVQALARDARGTVTEALAELRDIVRGLHPPALDDGLDVALASLAGRSAVPASVAVALPARPSAATASAVYFTVAELLTNIARHSGATRAGIALTQEGRWLTLTVTDNGHGGAAARSGTGLTGLTRRAEALDGTLSITSPPGGPTTITMTLPRED